MIFGVATEVEDPEGDGQYPATHPGDQADGDAVEISAGTEYRQEHTGPSGRLTGHLFLFRLFPFRTSFLFLTPILEEVSHEALSKGSHWWCKFDYIS